jgi:hypothetical protein
VKAAEKDLQMTIPLTANFWALSKVRPRGAHRLSPRLRSLGRLPHRTMAFVIRVGRRIVNIAGLRARKLEFDRM